ncbi:unnamed protein product [Adineta ricciae]|uniref:Uncharacterized protein n=1 Tax=Adineta ricciae TaxID=249248 RepID=A0A813PN97_ADIRI|nr:unnamed protein product [Adineta ricciae]
MPRIRTNSSTPESRRRELLLLKSSSIDGRIKTALNDAKNVVRKSVQFDTRKRLSYAKQLSLCDIFEANDLIECTTILPPIHRASTILLFDENDSKHHARISSTTYEFVDQNKKLSTAPSIYHVELALSDDDDDDDVRDGTYRAHFITCCNIVPDYQFLYHGRRRTSSLPSSTITFDLSIPIKQATSTNRSSSLMNITSWQNNPQKVVPLLSSQYYCQPISQFRPNQFLLATAAAIDIYNIQTGFCEEQLRLQSTDVNYIALCYNQYKQELFVASTTDLYVYNLVKCQITHKLRLPGCPFNLDHNSQIRYLTCNSSSIYHGYFTFSSTKTSTVLSRLSQFGLKLVADLEFEDATMHGLHAFENHIGVIVRYGRYSFKQREHYCLYIYDSLLKNIYYQVDLNDVGCITCLSGYERTLDWILCDSNKQRILFVNQESIEYVQYDEQIQQCMILNESNWFIVWAKNRMLVYPIE